MPNQNTINRVKAELADAGFTITRDVPSATEVLRGVMTAELVRDHLTVKVRFVFYSDDFDMIGLSTCPSWLTRPVKKRYQNYDIETVRCRLRNYAHRSELINTEQAKVAASNIMRLETIKTFLADYPAIENLGTCYFGDRIEARYKEVTFNVDYLGLTNLKFYNERLQLVQAIAMIDIIRPE